MVKKSQNDYGQLGLGADDPLVNIPRELTEPKEMLSSEIVDVVCIGDQTLFLTGMRVVGWMLTF